MQLEAFLKLFRNGKMLKELLFAWHSTISQFSVHEIRSYFLLRNIQ